MPLLEVRSIHKWFGSLHAVQDVTFDLDDGQILGFIGPNGAGKTTTIRILAGLANPAQGQVHVHGYSVRLEPEKTRALTGYMPDNFGPYENTRVDEYLDFFADAFGIAPGKRKTLVDEVLELTDLAGLRHRDVDTLSKGESQRVALARCLMHDPKLLLLDEPAAGLDPRARIELRELLKELSRMGKAVLISSHILTELEDLCTHVAVLDHGKLLACGTREQVLASRTGEIRFRADLVEGAEEAVRALQGLPGVSAVQARNGREVEGRFSGAPADASAIVARLVLSNFRILGFNQECAGLEEVFLRLTETRPEKEEAPRAET
ncbi:MAG: ABC transporter ATP-binding protein [Planctomycetes bacterium]|nr:ABC transporter ATP-binding protein [Planctomycetota bacterium]